MDFDEDAQNYSYTSLSLEAKPYVLQIYNVILQRVSTTGADQEVKERSILCLGVLLSRVGDELKEELELTTCLLLLLEKLQNELTRLMAVKTLFEKEQQAAQGRKPSLFGCCNPPVCQL